MNCSKCGRETQYEKKVNVPDDVYVIRADMTHAVLEKYAKWCPRCKKVFCGVCTLPSWQKRKEREGLTGEQLAAKIESDPDDGHWEMPTCPECGGSCELQGTSKCFIATAACGSPVAEELKPLRHFREEVLRPMPLGRWFVSKYETHTPAIALFIETRPFMRRALYWFVVLPVSAIVRGVIGKRKEKAK